MISTIRLAVNDDSDGCDSILQIGYLLGRTEGVGEFRRKSSKNVVLIISTKRIAVNDDLEACYFNLFII